LLNPIICVKIAELYLVCNRRYLWKIIYD